MSLPSPTPDPTLKEEKVLIWGAGGAVGQYAVQYAASVGHTVVATASPHSTASVLALGASSVLDYRSPTILADLRGNRIATERVDSVHRILTSRTKGGICCVARPVVQELPPRCTIFQHNIANGLCESRRGIAGLAKSE